MASKENKFPSCMDSINKEKDLRKPRKKWLYGSVTASEAIALIVTLNIAGSFSKNSAVYAMKQDYNRVLQGEGAYASFIEGLSNGPVELSLSNDQSADKPKVEVPVDLQAEQNDQKNADAGHSPWKLDAVFVSQVFISLKISPEGIKGDYPIKYEDIKVIRNTGTEAVVEASGNKTPVRRVYLKKLIRKDATGIWTVVGYDPVKSN